MTRLMLLIGACAVFIGCTAQRATLRGLEPAHVNALPRTLAVLDVHGGGSQAPQALDALTGNLREIGFYTLVEERESRRRRCGFKTAD